MKLLGRSLSVISLVAATALGGEVPRDPEDLAGYFMRKMARLDFEGVANHTSLVDAQRFKDLQVQAARLAEKAGSKDYFLDMVTWAGSADEIENMPAREVYGRYLERQLQTFKFFPDEYEAMVKDGKTRKIEVIGHTMDGVDRMLVKYRSTWTENGKLSSMTGVMSVRKEGGSWMLGIHDLDVGRVNETIQELQRSIGEQGGAEQPATALESKPEGEQKPKSDSEGCSQ
jgi:hypothetical protein